MFPLQDMLDLDTKEMMASLFLVHSDQAQVIYRLWAPGTLVVETFEDWEAVERYLITNYYTTYKTFNVDNTNPQSAWDTMERFKGSYYNLLTSVVDIKNSPLASLAGTSPERPDSENCLTFAKKVLEAYGVKNLPSILPFITSAPNNYFLSIPGEIHSTISDIEQESTLPSGTHSKPPTVQAFSVSPIPPILNLGESFTIEYTVSDTDGSGLNRVELWRKDEQSDWQEIKRDAISGGNGPISSSFTDAPSTSGKYWYGIHVADNAGNWNDEKNSNTNNHSVSFEPIEVEIKSAQETGQQEPSTVSTQPTNQPITLTLYVHDGSASGPLIPGAQVTGQDASGNSFSQITDENGFVVITGSPGSWQFTATKSGYDVNSWSQEITETGTKHAYLFAEKMPTISSTENDVQSTTQNVSSGSETSADSELGDLINALKDNDAGVRLKAAEALGKLADARAVDPLIEALRYDEDGDVRQKAAWALGQIDDSRTIDPLSYASVKDAQGYVRVEAYDALQKSTVGGNKVDARSVDPIIGALKDEDQGVRYRAAEALGQIKNTTAVDALIEALNDEDGDVRQKAAWALGQIDDSRTIDPLSYASVKDAQGYVRVEAYDALQKSTVGGNKVDARSVDPIIGALKDEDQGVRYRAAEALGQLKNATAVDALIEALNDENGDVRQKAAWALGQIDDARTIDPLSYASVKDAEGYVREEAYNALQKSTVGGNKVDARSVDPIIGALKDEDQGVRYRAAEALGQIKNTTAVDALIEALNDEDGDVRQKAAWALGEIGDVQAVDPLNYASVKDAQGYVQDEAKKALEKLGVQVE